MSTGTRWGIVGPGRIAENVVRDFPHVDGATVTAVGDSFNNASNSQRLDCYVVTDLRASFPIVDHVEVYGRIENAFDQRYQTILQYGQPGRGAFGGVRLTY